MAQVKVTTNRVRRIYPLRSVTGYSWSHDVEYEILECGHKSSLELPCDQYSEESWTEWATDNPPRRRRCKQCEPTVVRLNKLQPKINVTIR